MKIIINKKSFFYIKVIAIGIIVISFFVFFKQYTKHHYDYASICTQYNGEWDKQYKECSSFSYRKSIEDFCLKYNGHYSSCASACRHYSNNVKIGYGNFMYSGCSDECVQVCSFN